MVSGLEFFPVRIVSWNHHKATAPTVTGTDNANHHFNLSIPPSHSATFIPNKLVVKDLGTKTNARNVNFPTRCACLMVFCDLEIEILDMSMVMASVTRRRSVVARSSRCMKSCSRLWAAMAALRLPDSNSSLGHFGCWAFLMLSRMHCVFWIWRYSICSVYFGFCRLRKSWPEGNDVYLSSLMSIRLRNYTCELDVKLKTSVRL
jgi:hypothetical protein